MSESLRQVPVEELVFDVVDVGPRDAEPVLLLHGFPQSSHEWRFIWPVLADAGYRVIAPDQRGYSPGARPLGAESYELPHLLGDALGILDALGIEQAHVVGHDWGAFVAWHLASRHADRVRTLTAVSVPHPVPFTDAIANDPDQIRRSSYMEWFRKEGEAEDLLIDHGGLERTFHGAGPGVDTETYLALMRDREWLTAALNWYRGMRPSDTEGLHKVTVPTLYVWSDADPSIGEVAALGTAAWVEADYRFEVFGGASHWIPEEQPERLAGLLLEHLHR